MHRPVPLIRSSLLSEFPALVRQLGGPLDDILDSAGLSLEQIEQPTLLIPFDKQIHLLQLAAQRCSYEAFAIELARRQDVAVFGALSLLVVNATTVQHGLRMFSRYLHYSVQAVNLQLREEDELAWLAVNTPYELAYNSDQFWDHALAMSCTVIRLLCGQGWAPRAVHMRRPEPADASRHTSYFRCAVAFSSETSALVFERKALLQPINPAINNVPLQLQAYLRNSFEGDFPEQLRRVIDSLLATHNCTARTVAQCMGYSPRTLQRKLAAEQTSFQQQLDRVRSELAISYLQEKQFSLIDIAELLGFAESSVFTRSFRRWFGITPSQWRQRKFS